MRWLKWPLYAATFVFVFVLATAFTIRVLLLDEPTVNCPELRGMDVETAKVLAAKAGLPLVVERYEKRTDVAYNRVVIQKPDAGVPVRPGRTVTVILSDGPMLAMIPSFVGLSLEEARASLASQGMNLKKIIYAPSENVDRVLAQVPETGENILDKDGVVLVVGSREKRYYVMPYVAPGDYGAAVKEMEKKRIGYVVTPAGLPAGGVPAGVAPLTIFRGDKVIELQTTGGT